MNDINPTTGLSMSGGGIDAGGTPYGSSSSDNEDYESGYDGFNNIANYWSWKVDVVLMLIAIGVNVYFGYRQQNYSLLFINTTYT